MIKIPKFNLTDEGNGVLTETYTFNTPFLGHVAAMPKALLCADGTMIIEEGFEWDFGSGPAIDTPAMVYGSLGHDVMYELMHAGELSWDMKGDVDIWFRELLKEAGMGWARRTWVYWGVKYGHAIWSLFQ